MIAMRLLTFAIFLFLTSCTPPVYQNTTFDIAEFTADSRQIAQGKWAVLALEEQENECVSENHSLDEDVIMDGDELSIILYCPRRPDRMYAFETMNERTGFRVCDGKISLPHLSSVEVGGLTLNKAQENIQAAYCKQLSDVQLFLNFKKQCERNVQIIGASQSMIPVDGRMRLSEVLAKARLHPYANLFKSYVIREGQQLPIDLYKLIHEGDESQNLVMRRGDQIFIANTMDAPIMVTGEVGHSMVIPISYGFMSLREALVLAGGIPFTGSKECIQVIRGELVRPKVYCLAWKEITHLPNQSLLLMPGDVVVVSEKPITQWNRFISQLQSSTGCMQTGAYAYQGFILQATLK